MDQLQDVRETLAPLEIDVTELREQADRDWSTFGEHSAE